MEGIKNGFHNEVRLQIVVSNNVISVPADESVPLLSPLERLRQDSGAGGMQAFAASEDDWRSRISL